MGVIGVIRVIRVIRVIGVIGVIGVIEVIEETKKREAEQKNASEPAPATKKIKIVLDLRAGKATTSTTPDEILKQVLLSSSQQDKNFSHVLKQ